MINKNVYNILVVVVAIGAFNWLLYDNGKDLVSMISNNNAQVSSMLYKIIGLCGLVVLGCIIYIVLLIIAITYPLMNKKNREEVRLHPEAIKINEITIPTYERIAVALDFSQNDYKLISHALGQGNKESQFMLIHVVESPATRIIGNETDDLETRKDKERMDLYVTELKEKGFAVSGLLGFNGRVKEIVRLVKDNDADLLVIGAHGHSGIKDVVYGETVEAVRHELKIPVLVVNI
jgi:manganese transport protein